MTTEMWIIAAIRVGSALPVLRWPLAGAFIALFVDLSDLFLRDWLQLGGVKDYQSFDKWLDQAYMITFLIVALRWEPVPRNIAIALFAFRLVGLIAFELTGDREILILFPNLFEFWFIFIAALKTFGWEEEPGARSQEPEGVDLSRTRRDGRTHLRASPTSEQQLSLGTRATQHSAHSTQHSIRSWPLIGPFVRFAIPYRYSAPNSRSPPPSSSPPSSSTNTPSTSASGSKASPPPRLSRPSGDSSPRRIERRLQPPRVASRCRSNVLLLVRAGIRHGLVAVVAGGRVRGTGSRPNVALGFKLRDDHLAEPRISSLQNRGALGRKTLENRHVYLGIVLTQKLGGFRHPGVGDGLVEADVNPIPLAVVRAPTLRQQHRHSGCNRYQNDRRAADYSLPGCHLHTLIVHLLDGLRDREVPDI